MIRLKWSCLGVLLFVTGTLFAAEWSWQQAPARVSSKGDLKWSPKPFQFIAGKSLRYIDYENGNDSNDGSKASPWKHHPWDTEATGKAKACTGIHTYIFKGGVTYRGALQVKEGGKPGQPIRLTRDPNWGKGEAVISGSELARNWKRGATNKNIPEKDKVWYTDLDFAPRCVWMVAKGKITRLPLARTPNWQVKTFDDIKSEWYEWDNPGKHFGNRDGQWHKAFDTKHINKPADYYKKAVIWSEWGWVMGTPYPTNVENVDTAKKSLSFRGQWGGPSGQIIRGCRYFLEDKPHYLDDPNGEFWFEKKGQNSGRLYVRLPNDQDPNTVAVEAGKRLNLIDAQQMDHIEISGLTFRFTNVYWDLTATPGASVDVSPACIRLRGQGNGIAVRNCLFEHVNNPILFRAAELGHSIGGVVITDNTMRYTDHSAIQLFDGGGWGNKAREIARLLDCRVMRNQLTMIGMRPNRYGQGHALEIECAETLEVAGNFLDRCYGSGIHIFGAKRSRLQADRPLSRILIHHNKVTNPMLNTNDWGGIETWQGGPAYVYNNISGNPGGYWNWKFKNHPKEAGCGRFGHAYYLDGAFKNYHFNNIAWGKSKDPYSPLGNTSAFQEIHSYQNTFFNNTVYNFVIGSRRQSPHAGRDKFLSNVWDSIGSRVFRHADPAKTMADANAADAGVQKTHFDLETNAYSDNIFFDVNKFGVLEPSGRWLDSFDVFKQGLKKYGPLQSNVGTVAKANPLRDPAKHDFRLAEGSTAVDQGAKVFVPWSLYAMVAEWNFCPIANNPTRIMDEHWYMTPQYGDRQGYHKQPMFPLTGVNIAVKDYVEGNLEDWTKGALKLNGKDQYAVLANAKLAVKQEKPDVYKKKPYDWVKIDAPEVMLVGKTATVNIELVKPVAGQKLHCDVHWTKNTGKRGGINKINKSQKITGKGPYQFRFAPVDKSGMKNLTLIVFTSTDGSWKSKVDLASQDVAITQATGDQSVPSTPGIDRSSFVIETYFSADAGNGVLIEKTSAKAGFSVQVDQSGHVNAVLKGSGKTFTVKSSAKVTDGKWHHVLLECDRSAKTLKLYIDGKEDSQAPGPSSSISLANESDLYVGGTPNGRCLAATLDFMRISLGSLADAKTSFEELYAWQFNGPFLRDFTGAKPRGKRRDAGALELQ